MRVLIPASGGLDSTTLLWETLTGTAHEVVAVHYDESWLPVRVPDREAAAAAAFGRIVDWLRRETRDFEAVRGSVAEAGPRPPEPVPVREGSRQTYDMSWQRTYWRTIAGSARALDAAEAWIAFNTWNRRRPPLWPREEAIWAELADVAFRLPWLDRTGDIWTGRSRLGNLRRIPAGLHALTVRCNNLLQGECQACVPCRARAFHKAHCRDLDEAAFARVEERIEELAHFGRHVATADLRTYDHGLLNAVLNDIDEWPAWFEAERLGGG